MWSSESQIRTVLQQFRDRVLPESFPGRGEVPKTLIFAKDDSHADDIVRIAREVFAEGNDFCRKITYRTGFTKKIRIVLEDDGSETEVTDWVKTSSLTPDEILSNFRLSFFPRIAVTVDMISTGTDVKPIECVFFMRKRRIRRLLRADEGPRGAGDIARQAARGDSERKGEGSIHRRRRGRRFANGTRPTRARSIDSHRGRWHKS